MLDVATGTGDLAIELAAGWRRAGEVVGTDFSERMLELARGKDSRRAWEGANALELPYADDCFDAATVGFGARNFSDLERGLAEMARVARPGGRVVILEITTPQRPPLSWFFALWFDRVVPLLGRLGLPAPGGVQCTCFPGPGRFPPPAGVAATMERAGLTSIRWVLTGGGIVTIHLAK